MGISEKIKAIDNKVEQNKVQYNLDTQTAKFLLYHQQTLVNINC